MNPITENESLHGNVAGSADCPNCRRLREALEDILAFATSIDQPGTIERARAALAGEEN